MIVQLAAELYTRSRDRLILAQELMARDRELLIHAMQQVGCVKYTLGALEFHLNAQGGLVVVNAGELGTGTPSW